MTAETIPAGAMPAATGATPVQTTTEPEVQPPATGADPTLGEGGRKALETERQARRDAEQRAKTASEELAKLRAASQTADERRDARLADLERKEAGWAQERQEMLLQLSVARHAAKLGFTDPTDAVGLLDRATITFDDDGTPKDMEKALTDLLAAKPYLGNRPTGTADGGARGTPTGGRTYLESQLNDRDFFEKNRDDIMRAARENRIRPG